MLRAKEGCTVYMWMAMVTWSTANLAGTAINWRGRISYERARASSAAVVTHAVSGGGVVWDERADGTVLRVEIPPQGGTRPAAALFVPRAAAGDNVAKRR
jgi:hypothetical protein